MYVYPLDWFAYQRKVAVHIPEELQPPAMTYPQGQFRHLIGAQVQIHQFGEVFKKVMW